MIFTRDEIDIMQMQQNPLNLGGKKNKTVCFHYRGNVIYI